MMPLFRIVALLFHIAGVHHTSRTVSESFSDVRSPTTFLICDASTIKTLSAASAAEHRTKAARASPASFTNDYGVFQFSGFPPQRLTRILDLVLARQEDQYMSFVLLLWICRAASTAAIHTVGGAKSVISCCCLLW